MIDRRNKVIAKTCTDKRSFFTTRSASRAAARIRNSSGVDMRWYECPYCKKWHLTKKRRDE